MLSAFWSCEQASNILKIQRDSVIVKGQVTPLAAAMASNKSSLFNSFYSYAAGCSAQASLYKMSLAGEKIGSAISTATLNGAAEFELKIDPFKLKSIFVDHMIEVKGSGGGVCDYVFMRPVVGDRLNQNIDWASTLVSMTNISTLPKKLPQNRSSIVENFIAQIDSSNFSS